MTEADAKTKWCPFARDSETAGNRSILTPHDIRFPCIGSDCMAWRALIQFREPSGYCGLAGAQS